MTPPKAILFDLDDTLLDMWTAMHSSWEEICADVAPGLGCDAGDLRETIRRESALFWADEEAVGEYRVKPLESRTPLMSGIDLSQSFALKAFLDHGTLTVGEYCEIARAPQREGFHLFRSLVDLHVIEATGAGSAADSGTAAPPRYRLRPLMAGAVAAHLRSLNILH